MIRPMRRVQTISWRPSGAFEGVGAAMLNGYE
jgi:hypothetical protein